MINYSTKIIGVHTHVHFHKLMFQGVITENYCILYKGVTDDQKNKMEHLVNRYEQHVICK